eukprot:5840267-Prymnesium_polylepis.2
MCETDRDSLYPRRGQGRAAAAGRTPEPYCKIVTAHINANRDPCKRHDHMTGSGARERRVETAHCISVIRLHLVCTASSLGTEGRRAGAS